MRQWFRERVGEIALLNQLPLFVDNEVDDAAKTSLYLRLSRRQGRVFVEVFGPRGDGDGPVQDKATQVEEIWRKAVYPEFSPAPLIVVSEPSSFARPEADQYCQVVSVPFHADRFS